MQVIFNKLPSHYLVSHIKKSVSFTIDSNFKKVRKMLLNINQSYNKLVFHNSIKFLNFLFFPKTF